MALLWIGIRRDVPVHPLATLLVPAVMALVNGTRPILPSGDARAQPFRPKVIANLQIASKQKNADLSALVQVAGSQAWKRTRAAEAARDCSQSHGRRGGATGTG